MVWGGLSLNHRVLLVLFTVGVTVAVVVTVRWLGEARYTTLYTGLEAEEAGEIVDQLTSLGVPYRISAGGTAILVPDKDAQSARLKMASQGYPRGGAVGYEIFDKTDLGMTDFLQRVNFRRALEGEIAKSIMSLSEVAAARVHLVIPERRLFARDQKPATASVVLKLNRPLSPGQIAGIEHLVASSVEGLTPEHIAIVDYKGNLLTDSHAGDEDAQLSSTQLDLRKNVERYLETKAQSMLDGTLGTSRSIVRVIAELNFDKVEKNSEVFDPDLVAIRSEETTTASPGPDGGGQQNSTITNYEITKSVERVVSAYGNIQRLSAAIIVDGTYAVPAGAPEDAEAVYQPRSAEELQKIGALVQTAIGFDSTRSDRIEVVNLAFDNRTLEETQNDLDQISYWQNTYEIGEKVLWAVAILVGLFYLRKVLKQLALALSHPVGARPSGASYAGAAEAEAELPAEPQRIRPKDVFIDRARGRPEEVAKIIKTMMIE
jgi:flagellar M-ring protein FliF